ncbi:MAG: hypothetical protein U0U66_11930 [Cytophagaceae bacterium]
MKGFLSKYLGFLFKNKEEGVSSEEISVEELLSVVKEEKEEKVISPTLSSAVAEEEGPESFARYLSLRLYPKSHSDKFPIEEFYVQETIEDTITVLVLDYPSSIEHVLRSNAAKWAWEETVLFERAIKNVQESYHRVVKPFSEFKSQGMLTLSGSDAFKTSALLYLEEYPAITAKHGALIAFPDKDHLLSMPITNDISLEIGMKLLIPFVDKTFHTTEYPLSKLIYWYYEGSFQSIPYVIGLERSNYVLPFELEDRLY